MVALAENFLGKGMYSPREAAMYARVTTQLMSRWVHGDKRGRAAFQAEVPDPDEKTISFLDFVQTMAIREIRAQQDVSLQKIRQAVDLAHEQGITYPFARKHVTYFFDGDIHLEVEGVGLIQATGDQRRQLSMRKLIEMYLVDLSFNPEGLADLYTVVNSNGVQIVMKPDYYFGEPVIARSGQTAWTLHDAVISEGSFEAAAEAFDATPDEVEVAYRYIASIRPPTPA